jgi:glucose-6-phosphate dehydrogenase assembly protein OpcA
MSNSEITSLGEPKTVDVVAIERELTALWRSASSTDVAYPVIRACAMNLLVYMKGDQETRRAIDWIGKLITRHPCRAIIMSVDPTSVQPGLSSWISTLCHLPSNGSQQVCCEQIVLEAHGDSLCHLPGAVFPLLLPDLPVFLWWNDVPDPGDEVLLKFGMVAQKLILDSRPFSNPRTQFVRLISLSQKVGWRAALGDMNWGRLRLWRRLLAQFFDCPNYRTHLQSVNRMTIEYHGQNRKLSTLPAQPLLLAGWFTSRLGWTPVPERHSVEGLCHSLFFRKGAGELSLQICMEMEGSQEHGEITAVQLEVSGESETSFSLTRRGNLAHSNPAGSVEVEAKISGQDVLQRSVSFSGLDQAALLGDLLDIPGHDPVFEQALSAAIGISCW